MPPLANEQCEEINAQSTLATPEELTEMKAQLPDWQIINDSMDKLECVFRFRTFAQALAFTNAVGSAAEEQNHHPRIVTEWGKVTVTWWTHFLGGLHRNDFIMAARTGALAGSDDAG